MLWWQDPTLKIVAYTILHAVQVSEDDILLRKEIDEMAKKHSNFKVQCWLSMLTSAVR